jgi:hypothetical protein
MISILISYLAESHGLGTKSAICICFDTNQDWPGLELAAPSPVPEVGWHGQSPAGAKQAFAGEEDPSRELERDLTEAR